MQIVIDKDSNTVYFLRQPDVYDKKDGIIEIPEALWVEYQDIVEKYYIMQDKLKALNDGRKHYL